MECECWSWSVVKGMNLMQLNVPSWIQYTIYIICIWLWSWGKYIGYWIQAFWSKSKAWRFVTPQILCFLVTNQVEDVSRIIRNTVKHFRLNVWFLPVLIPLCPLVSSACNSWGVRFSFWKFFYLSSATFFSLGSDGAGEGHFKNDQRLGRINRYIFEYLLLISGKVLVIANLHRIFK